MMTVLPTPAPPKTPILPPLRNGAIRSMTLMPVSKTSASVACSSKDGAGAVDRVAAARPRPAPLAVDRLAEHVEDAARASPRRPARDRRAGVDRVHAAAQAVGRAHGDGAHPVVAEVLLHLARRASCSSVLLGRSSRARCRSRAAASGGNSTSTTGPDDLDDASALPVGSVRLPSCVSLAPSRAASRAGRRSRHLAGDRGLTRLVVARSGR